MRTETSKHENWEEWFISFIKDMWKLAKIVHKQNRLLAEDWTSYSGKLLKLHHFQDGIKNEEQDRPLSENIKLPKLNNANQKIQFDFIGQNCFKNRKTYIVLSIDRYVKVPSTVENILGQCNLKKWVPKCKGTEKEMAFTGI